MHSICLQQPLIPRTKVELLDLAAKIPCALGEVYDVPNMTFHGNSITDGHCIVVVIAIKKGFLKVPFSSPIVSKMKYTSNGIVL
jgi:hypothetical protein